MRTFSPQLGVLDVEFAIGQVVALQLHLVHVDFLPERLALQHELDWLAVLGILAQISDQVHVDGGFLAGLLLRLLLLHRLCLDAGNLSGASV